MVRLSYSADHEVPNGRITPTGLPAHVQLIQMGVAIWQARAVYAAAELGIADILAGGPAALEDIARQTGTHAPSLYRLLRALESCGIIEEASHGKFITTALGDALRDGAPGAARATILTIAGSWQWKAWDHILHALRTGETGLKVAYQKDLFEFLAAEPLHSTRFNEAMVGLYGPIVGAVVAAYDFSPFPTVVDVGGGKGALLAAILKANPRMKGILFDLPELEHDARDYILNSGSASRCTFRPGDFFESVPTGHSAYLLAHVLHDWRDKKAIAILRNCRKAMDEHARLFIIEAVVPVGSTPHHSKLIDLLMLTVTGGIERTQNEFGELLSQSGFVLAKVFPTATHQSIIEAVPSTQSRLGTPAVQVAASRFHMRSAP